jgi:hypothetical protein
VSGDPGACSVVKVRANVDIIAYDKQGRPKVKLRAKNLIVDEGLDHLVKEFMEGVGSEAGRIGWGTDGTAPDPSDTELAGFKQIADGQWSVGGTGVAYVERTFAIVYNGTAREVGLYGVSGGTFIARATFAPIVLDLGEAFYVKWTITFTDGSP